MELFFEPAELRLSTPFTIARGTQTVAHGVFVRLESDGIVGIGEAAPSEHYGDFQASALAYLNLLKPALAELTTVSLQGVHAAMDETARLNPAARAAVDMAVYDWLGKALNCPVYRLLGLDPARAPRTSFTIGIDMPEIMGQKAAEARDYPILKVKVGTAHDVENLEAIRAERPDAVLRVDANEAWTPKEAVARIEQLAEFDLEFVEQPVVGSDLEGLGYVQSASALPIFADESCVVPFDVPRVASYVDGINIKLMKCGGLLPALQMIHLARAHHLQIMMGCMVESSLAISAAAHLSPLIDYADLDGNLLLDGDPYRGVTVNDGTLVLSSEVGLGVRPAP